jgi:LacI family transcriptional regulator
VTQLAAAHLIERGFKHFGYCGEPRFLWAHQRAGYFRDHLRQAGFECSVFTPANRSNRASRMESEVLAIARWLRGLPKPVGILACYDIVGQQVLEACQFAGLAVPDAVAVLGVHNDELLCDLCDPPLTSVIPNARRAGYVAAGLLSEMMDRRRVSVEDHLVEPIGVAARQSTDVVAVRDERVAAAIRFIREHAQTNLVVGDVLRAMPMSRTLLERKFKECLGCTPHEHIQNTRMERVRTYLATTTLPIAAIADRMGFEHVEYLSVAFRRATGLSPRDYRARHRSHQTT